uniref:Uncharacterized protein n=1 Tax=Rhizophora mucronata TaxID=61149 RepID=A0A2P2K5A8_RHIMU
MFNQHGTRYFKQTLLIYADPICTQHNKPNLKQTMYLNQHKKPCSCSPKLSSFEHERGHTIVLGPISKWLN